MNRDWIETLDSLPSIPTQMAGVLEEVGKTSAMDYNIVKMIQYDPAIACRVLKLANAPLYGYPSRIASLQQASGLLGPGAIKNMILTTPVLERFNREGYLESEIDFNKLWLHSSIVAILSKNLSSHFSNLEADVAFTNGLIHDIGKIALAVVQPMVMKETVQCAQTKGWRLKEAEENMLGISHSKIGALLGAKWGFPNLLIEVLEQGFIAEQGEVSDSLTAVIHLARYLAFKWGFGDGLEPENPVCALKVFSFLDIADADINQWEPELTAVIESVLQTLDADD